MRIICRYVPRTKIQLKPVGAKPIETSCQLVSIGKLEQLVPIETSCQLVPIETSWNQLPTGSNWNQLPTGSSCLIGFNWNQLFQFPYWNQLASTGFNWFQLVSIGFNWIQLKLTVGINLISYKLISSCTNYRSCQHRSIVICVYIKYNVKGIIICRSYNILNKEGIGYMFVYVFCTWLVFY